MDKIVNESKRVDMIADEFVQKFDNPGGRGFYCKVGWAIVRRRVSESTIRVSAEKAQAIKKGSPAKVFTTLCKIAGV